MRGGAIPIFIWGVLLAIMAVINAIWTTGNVIQGCVFAFGVLSVWGLAMVLIWLAPEARRKGPPELRRRPILMPSASAGAAGAAIAFSAFTFGWAFGGFWIFFGAGILLAALGRLLLEHRAARRAFRRVLAEQFPEEEQAR